MEITIQNKFIIFPVNAKGAYKLVQFFSGDKNVYELKIRLDNIAPDFYAYVDVSRFMGQTLTLTVTPEMKISYQVADTMDLSGVYQETFRPQVHFTTKNGWLNDPNGLLYIDGVYHMFYQYNPCEYRWQNMHWGHATSTDLIHWEEKDTALFPDDTGTMFSGGGILDFDNLLGLQEGENPTAVLYYTGTARYDQNIAYSTDNFKTIHKYQGNPAVPHIVRENRDPKVVYCEELSCYVMALYLQGETYCLLTSHNLKDWEKIQEIDLPGDGECPDIFSLQDQNGNKKWILMGAKDRYFVGDFKDGKFQPAQPLQAFHYDSNGYAGQTFSHLPGGRVVRILWDRWDDLALCTPPFAGQMSIPIELTLKEFDGKYYLLGKPVEELKILYQDSQKEESIVLKPGTEKVFQLQDNATLLHIKGKYEKDVKLHFSVFGIAFSCDFAENVLTVNKKTVPISVFQDEFDLTVIVDRCSIEIFLDNGKIFMTDISKESIADRNLSWFSVNAEKEYMIEQAEIHALQSIWS